MAVGSHKDSMVQQVAGSQTNPMRVQEDSLADVAYEHQDKDGHHTLDMGKQQVPPLVLALQLLKEEHRQERPRSCFVTA